jgi:hypothetical protein
VKCDTIVEARCRSFFIYGPSMIAAATLAGFKGKSITLILPESNTACATAGLGGTMGTSPTPFTP